MLNIDITNLYKLSNHKSLGDWRIIIIEVLNEAANTLVSKPLRKDAHYQIKKLVEEHLDSNLQIESKLIGERFTVTLHSNTLRISILPNDILKKAYHAKNMKLSEEIEKVAINLIKKGFIDLLVNESFIIGREHIVSCYINNKLIFNNFFDPHKPELGILHSNNEKIVKLSNNFFARFKARFLAFK